MDWYEVPDHEGTYSVAGWQFRGEDWQDVEEGDGVSLESYDEAEFVNVERVTVHYVNSSGDDIYYTIWGPFEDWDAIADAVDYALDPYGLA